MRGVVDFVVGEREADVSSFGAGGGWGGVRVVGGEGNGGESEGWVEGAAFWGLGSCEGEDEGEE